MSDELNITPDKKEELWKFGDGSMKDIYEMNIVEVFTCTIHALKRIRHWTKQAHWYDYQLKITYDNQKKIDGFHYHKTRCNNNIYIFSTKMEALNERANELGEELPEKFDDVKAKLSVLKQKEPDEVES